MSSLAPGLHRKSAQAPDKKPPSATPDAKAGEAKTPGEKPAESAAGPQGKEGENGAATKSPAGTPGYLQAKRGSHIVVTTIMFNFIASALMTWLLVDKLIMPGSQTPATRLFAESAWIPMLHELAANLGIELPQTPLNATFFLALISLVVFYLMVWRSRWGYALRTVGLNEKAARYAGMPVSKVIIVAMCFSGALAGLAAVNELLGSTHRMNLAFTNGIGFVGIAVALMGRNHPFGILLSALLFGALTQGGLDLSFEKPAITHEMIILTQGLIILFCGALENLFQTPLALAFKQMTKR